MERNTKEFYDELARNLSILSETQRWTENDVVTVSVNGEEYQVGPFEKLSFEEDDFNAWDEYTGFRFEDDDYIVCAGESFDSWGLHYSENQRVSFEVGQLLHYKPIYKLLW